MLPANFLRALGGVFHERRLPVRAVCSGVADQKLLYQHDFAGYLDTVSEQEPVGVCERCLILRLRSEASSSELCAASILERGGFSRLGDAEPHQWRAFTSRDALEPYLAEHFPRLRDLQARADELGLLPPED